MSPIAVLIALAACVQAAPEENRDYKSWSGFKPGSWTKMTMEMNSEGRAMTMELTKTLKSIDDKEAVVEIKSSMNAGGRKMDLPGRDEHIPAKGPSKYQPVKEKDKVEEGDEELELGGKKVKCHWFKCTVDQEKWKGTAKVWLSPDLPGAIAKMESVGDEKGSTLKMTANAWESK